MRIEAGLLQDDIQSFWEIVMLERSEASGEGTGPNFEGSRLKIFLHIRWYN
jgi:hypothetical protein